VTHISDPSLPEYDRGQAEIPVFLVKRAVGLRRLALSAFREHQKQKQNAQRGLTRINADCRELALSALRFPLPAHRWPRAKDLSAGSVIAAGTWQMALGIWS
jgi:hypothetical protein